MTSLQSFLNPHSRAYYGCRWLILTALGLIVYGQTFGFGFVFDDYEFIVNNPYIKSFDKFSQVWEYFPLTRLVGMYSFALNYWLNQLHPAGYHVFNFTVHVLTAGLVWGIAGLLFRKAGSKPHHWLQRELPFITALLFLVHPCQIQAITYISQRFESMAALCYLASFYCYVRARIISDGKISMLFFAGAAVFAVVGIFTKETVATLPLAILAYEGIFKEKGRRWNILHIAGTALGAVVLVCILETLVHTRVAGILTQLIPSESHDGDMVSTPKYVLTQMRVFLTFLRLLVFPVHQNLDYDYPLSTGLIHPPLTLAGLGVITAMAGAIMRWRRKMPLVAFGLAWILITFSINLAPRSNVIFEHKLYLISFGFFLALTAWLHSLERHYKIIGKCLVCVIVLLSALSVLRNHVWKNELFLWEDIARKSPGKARVFVNLGRVYGEAGRLDDAALCFSKAIALVPDNNIAYVNRGVIYSKLGRDADALNDFNRAVILDPSYYSTYVKRAWVYKTQNNYDAAFADLAKAIELEPNFPPSYIERAMLYMEKDRLDDAFMDAQAALRLAPYDYDALIIRGVVYYTKGNYEKALQDFTLARGVNPSNPLAYKNLAYCFFKMGRTGEADEMHRKFTGLSLHK